MSVLNISMTGDDEYDFGTPTSITDIEVRLDALPPTVNIIDGPYPERISRAGWVALGGITSVDGVTTETYYWDAQWIDFANSSINYENGGYLPQFVRWHLLPGVTGVMRIST